MKERCVFMRPSFVSSRYVSQHRPTWIGSNGKPKLKYGTGRLSHCKEPRNRIRARFDYVIISEHSRRELKPIAHCV
jgi:hypothetical protein